MIDRILKKNRKTLKDFPRLPLLDGSMGSEYENRLIADELNYNTTLLAKEFKQLMTTMTNERKQVFDKIMHTLQLNLKIIIPKIIMKIVKN